MDCVALLRGAARRGLAALSVWIASSGVAAAAAPEEPVVDALPPIFPLLDRAQPGVFDVRDAVHYSGLGLARIYARPENAQHFGPGVEVRFADQLVWTRSAAQLESAFGGSLRLLPHGYALSVAQSGGAAGVRLGP